MKAFLQYTAYVSIALFIMFIGIAVLSQLLPSQQDILPTATMIIKGLK